MANRAYHLDRPCPTCEAPVGEFCIPLQKYRRGRLVPDKNFWLAHPARRPAPTIKPAVKKAPLGPQMTYCCKEEGDHANCSGSVSLGKDRYVPCSCECHKKDSPEGLTTDGHYGRIEKSESNQAHSITVDAT